MNTPNRIHADDLAKDYPICSKDGKNWNLGRPLGLQGLFLLTRLKRAWDVFRGRADALYWTKQ